jgi:hypothetical protein
MDALKGNHDLILVDLSDALKRRFGEAQITNGKLVMSGSQNQSGLEPDLIVSWPNDSTKIAVELELSDKAEKRYREIVLRYRLSSEYAQVIYFADDPFIQSLLTRVILNRKPHAEERLDTGKFYFSCLTELINNPVTTPITNGALELREKGGQI